MDKMNFSEALAAMRGGEKICREGWNGKGMYIYIPYKFSFSYPPLKDDRIWKEGAFEYSPFIVMKTADNKLVPWLASQTDLLSDDWQNVSI